MTVKRIVGLSPLAYDTTGARTVYIEPGAFEQLNSGARRATRTKTLDGGAVVYDAGFSVADQTFGIKVRADRTTPSYFAWLVQSQNLIRVSTEMGIYTGVPARWDVGQGMVMLEFQVMVQEA